MTDRQQKLDAITDDLYYYMVGIVNLASNLESLGLVKDGDALREIAGQLELVGIRLLRRMKPRHKRA